MRGGIIENGSPHREQVIGRTSQNKTLNFSHPSADGLLGQYLPVRVTRSGPNSLVGEAA